MKNFSKYILLVVVALGLIVIANAKMPLWRRLVDKVKQGLRKVKQGGKEECSDSAAGAVSDHTSQQSEIPIIDISGLVSADATQESKKAVAAQLVQACEGGNRPGVRVIESQQQLSSVVLGVVVVQHNGLSDKAAQHQRKGEGRRKHEPPSPLEDRGGILFSEQC